MLLNIRGDYIFSLRNPSFNLRNLISFRVHHWYTWPSVLVFGPGPLLCPAEIHSQSRLDLYWYEALCLIRIYTSICSQSNSSLTTFGRQFQLAHAFYGLNEIKTRSRTSLQWALIAEKLSPLWK
jgi:hypothetical protein